MGFWSVWRRRLCDPQARSEYWSIEGHKFIFVFVYFAVNLAVFTEAAIRWNHINSWITMARGFGALLNLNCALILVPVMRTFLSWMRRWQLRNYLPLDKNIIFHRYMAYWILICSFFHGIAHYFNYSCCPELYLPLNPNVQPVDPSWYSKAGGTGNALIVVMLIMYSASHGNYRRTNNFSVFWLVHHLFIVFFALLLAHGPHFWKWFLGPGFLYLVERILRVWRGRQETIVANVHYLSSSVLHLELKKEGFVYQSGQYAFLNCPYLSEHEWHPFTITSSPEEEHLQFHIRAVGDWTRSLSDLLNPGRKRDLAVNKWIGPDGKTPILRVDGPFGAPAEHFFEFEYVVLIGAGIGVTPYASILKDVRARKQRGELQHLKKIYFFWSNRDSGSWEWFRDLLTELEQSFPRDMLEVHTYFTGTLSTAEIEKIIFSSTEYSTSSNVRESKRVFPVARALYDFEPVEEDELGLEEGNMVEIHATDENSWCRGKIVNTDRIGLFPRSYVVQVDQITQLEEGRFRHFGRPRWDEIFTSIRVDLEATNPKDLRVGVFFCGPNVMSKDIYKATFSESGKGRTVFQYFKENF